MPTWGIAVTAVLTTLTALIIIIAVTYTLVRRLRPGYSFRNIVIIVDGKTASNEGAQDASCTILPEDHTPKIAAASGAACAVLVHVEAVAIMDAGQASACIAEQAPQANVSDDGLQGTGLEQGPLSQAVWEPEAASTLHKDGAAAPWPVAAASDADDVVLMHESENDEEDDPFSYGSGRTRRPAALHAQADAEAYNPCETREQQATSVGGGSWLPLPPMALVQ